MLKRSLTHRSDTVVRRRSHQASATFSGALPLNPATIPAVYPNRSNTRDSCSSGNASNAPRPNQIRPRWVQVDISAYDLEIAFITPIHNHRLVSSLKQMTKKPVPAVVTLRVGPLHPFHPADQVAFRCLDKQMIVIGHQHVGVNLPTGLPTRLTQRL